MKKLYIVNPGHDGEGVYSLLGDDGEGLASHYCSCSFYAWGDLEADRPERKEEWKKRFGEYQVLRLGEDEMTREKLTSLNEKWAKANEEAMKKFREDSPKVVLTMGE